MMALTDMQARQLYTAMVVLGVGMTHCSSTAQKIGETDPIDSGTPQQDGSQLQDAGPCPNQCSDPHVLMDCNGNPVQKCANTEACNNGQCVNACDLALATKSGIGCEYYAVAQTNHSAASPWLGTCFAALVNNTWGAPVTVTASRGGMSFPDIGYLASGSGTNITYTPLAKGIIPEGKTAVFFLSDDDTGSGSAHRNCPPGLNVGVFKQNISAPGTVDTDAFHIESSAPVTVHTFFGYNHLTQVWPNYAAGASLLLPTSAWDTNYIAATTYDRDANNGVEVFQPVPDLSWIGFVAQQDGTDVTIVPTKTYPGTSTVHGATANTPSVYTGLKKGEFIRLQDGPNLSGSVLSSNKPIGTWGGVVPVMVEYPSYSSMHQQIPPVKLLGHEYVAVRYRNRYLPGPPPMPPYPKDERPPWRYVGVVNGTQLTYDPPQPSAPTTLEGGDSVEWHTLYWKMPPPDPNANAVPFVVRSQDANHPFLFGAHMTGNQEYATFGGPEYVNVVPSEQFLKNYGFFTEPSYPNTELVFIRKLGADMKYHDVTLDCAGTISNWTTIGSSQYQYARFELVMNGMGQGMCENGRHDASSDAPFGLTIWGWDKGDVLLTGASYAFVAGQGGQAINTVIVPPLPR
jgi:hypothetical protein